MYIVSALQCAIKEPFNKKKKKKEKKRKSIVFQPVEYVRRAAIKRSSKNKTYRRPPNPGGRPQPRNALHLPKIKQKTPPYSPSYIQISLQKRHERQQQSIPFSLTGVKVTFTPCSRNSLNRIHINSNISRDQHIVSPTFLLALCPHFGKTIECWV